MADLSAFQPDEHPVFPYRDFDGRQSVLLAIEVANTAKVRRAFQFALQRIRPAMIRTAHLARMSGWLSHNRRRVMPADVEESALLFVVASHNHNRLAGTFGCNEISRRSKLLDARGELPRTPKDRLPLKFEDAFVRVPHSRNGRGLGESGFVIVAVDNFA